MSFWIFLLVVFCIGVGGAYVAVVLLDIGEDRELFISPTEVRPWAEEGWRDAHDAVPTPGPPPANIPTGLSIVDNGSTIDITYGWSKGPDYEPKWEVLTVKNSGVVAPPEPGVVFHGSRLVVSEMRTDSYQQLAGIAFTPDFKQIQRGDDGWMDAFHGKRYVSSQDFLPSLQLVYGFGEDRYIKLLKMRVFDLDTHVSLTSGYSWSHPRDDGILAMWTTVKALHPAKLRVVLDVAVDDALSVDLRPEVGASITTPEGYTATVMGQVQGDANGSSTSTRDSSVEVTLNNIDERDKKHGYLVALTPESLRGMFTAVAVDRDGNEHRMAHDASLPGMILYQTKLPEDEVATIRLRYATRFLKIIHNYGELPISLNTGITNLADLRVPYITGDSGWEITQQIGDITQLQTRLNHTGLSSSVKLHLSENVTAGTLIDEFTTYATPPVYIYDDANKKISFGEEPPQITVLEKIKQTVERALGL